jgi:hypothetical protein
MTSSQELTPPQTAALQRLVERGFSLVAFPLYASAIGVRRDSFAALLEPVAAGGFRVLGEPCYLIDGNLTVRVRRGLGQYFVWKSKSVAATPDLLAQLAHFSQDLQTALSESK